MVEVFPKEPHLSLFTFCHLLAVVQRTHTHTGIHTHTQDTYSGFHSFEHEPSAKAPFHVWIISAWELA